MPISNLPTHIAIIPDGNRRWAQSRGLLSWKGHLEGARKAEEIIKEAERLGIPYLTLWASSYDNLVKRSREEIGVLERIYRENAEKLLKDNKKSEVRVRLLGEWRDLLHPETVAVLERLENETRDNKGRNLTLLIGYNGDREMIAAMNSLIALNSKIDADSLKANLWTKELPPVDLIIRTGGEPHLSAGFMMWDARYSELYFTEKEWPVFTIEQFHDAIGGYSLKKRRFGA